MGDEVDDLTLPASVWRNIAERHENTLRELFARAPRLGWDHWGYGYETERVPVSALGADMARDAK